MIPSLLQIPSAVSDSKLHSVLPNNGKGDFTFDRSTGATRINKDGLIEEVGYFSSELVQNGNFSELGDTIIVNGDMSLSGNITLDINSLGWNTNDAATSNAFISEHKLTIERLNGDARVYATNGVNTRNVLTVGKTYKLIFDIVENDGCTSFFYYRGGDYVSVSDLTLGRKTIYFTAQSNQLFILRNGTNNSSISIDNVSVKQVDPNDRWTLGTGWAYGTNKVEKTAGTGSILSQSNVVEANKKYKVSFDVVATAGYIDSVFIGGQSNGTNITATGSYTYIFDTTNVDSLGFNANSSFAGSVTNISVVEVQGDRPRLSYDITNGVVEKQPHLLLEPSSTNLVTFSEDYTQSVWTKENITVTSNAVISPDGTKNASILTDTSTNGQHRITTSALFSADGNNRVFSVFVKKGTSRYCAFNHVSAFSSSVNTVIFDFDTASYVATGTTTYIDELFTPKHYGNGWYKIAFRSDINSSAYNRLSIGLSNGTSYIDASYAGTGATVFVWGGQVEQQSYCTSYIPTAGTTITRAAETCNNSKPSVNSTEGVLYAEIARPVNDSVIRSIALSDNSLSDVVLIQYYNNNIGVVVKVGSAAQAVFAVSNTDLNLNKIAISWAVNNFKVYVNGSLAGTDTSGSTFSAGILTTLSFDNGGGSEDYYGKVKGLAVYNEALSESQLMQLTGVTASSIYNNFVTRTASFTVEALNEVKKVIDNL